jgi:hypothetical protein
MEPEPGLIEVLPNLKKMFSTPKLDKVAGGAPPRTSISDALVETFVGMLKIIRPRMCLRSEPTRRASRVP